MKKGSFVPGRNPLGSGCRAAAELCRAATARCQAVGEKPKRKGASAPCQIGGSEFLYDSHRPKIDRFVDHVYTPAGMRPKTHFIVFL